MIEGQKDLETGEVDIGGEGLLGSRRKREKQKQTNVVDYRMR